MATKYLFTVNGVDLSPYVERDSYNTSLTPIFTRKITTMDGVDHMTLIRERGSISVELNPQTAEDTALICKTLLKAPAEVQYHCLQRDEDVTAIMVANGQSAKYLSRCLAQGKAWNELDGITLEEL